jgi:DNA primase
VNDEKNHGVWCCDPCGKGGDVFRFVMDHQGVSFLDAVDFVVGRYGVESDAVTSESAPW